MSLYAKRLEKGRFVWPTPTDGVVGISASQLDYMLDGIDWRNPRHTSAPSRRHKRDICMRRRRRADALLAAEEPSRRTPALPAVAMGTPQPALIRQKPERRQSTAYD
jgi:hypothetical protein